MTTHPAPTAMLDPWPPRLDLSSPVRLLGRRTWGDSSEEENQLLRQPKVGLEKPGFLRLWIPEGTGWVGVPLCFPSMEQSFNYIHLSTMTSLRATAGMKAHPTLSMFPGLVYKWFSYLKKRTMFQARAEAKQNLVGSKSKARQMGSKQGRGHCRPGSSAFQMQRVCQGSFPQ